MIDRIETYDDTLKVILKPTKNFPVGYFYCDSDINTLNLVNSFGWHLHQQGKNIYVEAKSMSSKLKFHREYALRILDSYQDYIDHVNGIELDNTDNNLNSVTQQQNLYNKPTRGYLVNKSFKYFQPCIAFNQEFHRPYGVVKTELEACILQHKLETDYLESLTGKDDYYMYDFLKDRRQALGLLDLERTKQISTEEATYRHVLRYADNAWYYYRYNLEQDFKDNNIPVPKYSLDADGFMVHPITGKKLCPY